MRILQKYLSGCDNCKRLDKILNNPNSAVSFECVFKFLFGFREQENGNLLSVNYYDGVFGRIKKMTWNSSCPMHKKPSVKQKSLI